MKKVIICILLLLSLIFIAACDDVNESSEESTMSVDSSIEESKTSSENDSSNNESNIAGSSEEAESSEESEELSEEESQIEMPTGLSVVNGIYYLNCEGGNEFTGDPGSIIGSEFEFSNIDEMKKFLIKKEFSESDIKIMQYVFPKDKYGIRLGDMDNLWVPTGINFEYTQDACTWFGEYGVGYDYGINNDYFSIIIEDLDSYKSSKKSFDERYTLEGLKTNENILKIDQKTEVKDGITHYIINYNNKIAYRKKSHYSFEKDGKSFNVYILYESVGINESPDKIKEIELMEIIVKDKERSYRIVLKGDYINESIDYITGFGVEKISLK